jgi:hypothetical protein
MKINNYQPDEFKHKQKIMAQMSRCDELFSGFDLSPTIVDEKLAKTSFVVQAQQGKKIALAVLTLYAQCESILPKEFYDHFESTHRKEKAFNKINGRYLFLSELPEQQFDGILKIWFFYKEMLNAIWSLPDFSDVKLMYKRRDIDLFDIDEEDTLFGE